MPDTRLGLIDLEQSDAGETTLVLLERIISYSSRGLRKAIHHLLERSTDKSLNTSLPHASWNCVERLRLPQPDPDLGSSSLSCLTLGKVQGLLSKCGVQNGVNRDNRTWTCSALVRWHCEDELGMQWSNGNRSSLDAPPGFQARD